MNAQSQLNQFVNNSAPKHKFLMLKVVVVGSGGGEGELGEGSKSWLAGNRVTQQ